jgi:acyl dehydratase
VRLFKDFQELKGAVGTEVGISDWVEVTQDRIQQFAEATGDEQWIHVDVERAKRELPGGSTIAHGFFTLALVPELFRSAIGLAGIRNTINYGANRVRFLSPVPAGARVRARITVVAADDARHDGLRVTYGVTIEIEGSGRPACVAELIGVHYL